MNTQKVRRLTPEEIAAGVQISVPLDELDVVDVSDKHVESMARGFIMGSQAIGRRKEVRELLEDKVVKRIGRKGKYITDKLFDLIEGVYITTTTNPGPNDPIRYYQRPPNLQAIMYALDRVLGKPAQHTEHIEEKRGVMVIESIIRNLAETKTRNAEPSIVRAAEGRAPAAQVLRAGKARSDGGEFGDDDVDVRARKIAVS